LWSRRSAFLFWQDWQKSWGTSTSFLEWSYTSYTSPATREIRVKVIGHTINSVGNIRLNYHRNFIVGQI
jgi:hypothetical protein